MKDHCPSQNMTHIRKKGMSIEGPSVIMKTEATGAMVKLRQSRNNGSVAVWNESAVFQTLFLSSSSWTYLTRH
jgi:hypothetical protein